MSSSLPPLSNLSEAVVTIASCSNDVFLGTKEDDLVIALGSSNGVVHVGPWNGGSPGTSPASLVVDADGIVVSGTTTTSNLIATSFTSSSSVNVPFGNGQSVDLGACVGLLMGLVAPPAFTTSSLSFSNTIVTSAGDPTRYIDDVSYATRIMTRLSDYAVVYDNAISNGLYGDTTSFWEVAHTGAASFLISSDSAGNVKWQVPTSAAFAAGSNACLLNSNLTGTLQVASCNLALCPSKSSDPLLSIAYSIDATVYPTPRWSAATQSNPPTLLLSDVSVGSNVSASLPLTTLTTFSNAPTGHLGFAFAPGSSVASLSNVGLTVSLTSPPDDPAIVVSGTRTTSTPQSGNAFVTLSNALDPTGFAVASISPAIVVAVD